MAVKCILTRTNIVPVVVLMSLFGSLPDRTLAAYKIQQLATGLDLPVQVVQAPGDTGSIYVLEKQTNDFLDARSSGQITRVDLATGSKTSFLRVQDILKESEGGLKSLAFHPDFESNGKFYLAWVSNPLTGETAPRMRLDEYQVTAGTPVFSRTMLNYENLEPLGIHSIDWLGFHPLAAGPEKDFLYVSIGDGGLQADDPAFVNNAQSLNSIRGKILRLDVTAVDAYPADDTRNYGFPGSNPYANDGDDNTLGELYYTGLRNPWRASFDRETGDLYIGDVGFDTFEEINFAPNGQAGLDFGWASREGTVETPVEGIGGPQGSSWNPIFEIEHDEGLGLSRVGSITGGYVYHGPVEELQGKYIFAEARAREVLAVEFDASTDPNTFDGDNATNFTILTEAFEAGREGDGQFDVIVSFGEDAFGHLYLVDHSIGLFANTFDAGEIYRLIPDLAGDFNEDGFADAADLTRWQADYGLNDGADSDGDGDTDGLDFLAWQKSLSNQASLTAGVAVPEPSAALLLATSWAVLARLTSRHSTGH